MKTMRVTVAESNNSFILTSKDTRSPVICRISGLRFHDDLPLLQMSIDWINKGSYTNGQRKKLVTRTLIRLLRWTVQQERRSRLHTKEQNV